MEDVLVMAKSFWMNSHLSIARFSGRIKLNKHLYIVMPPEEDLVRDDISKAYTKLGRIKIIQMVEAHKSAADINAEVDKKKQEQEQQQLNLF